MILSELIEWARDRPIVLVLAVYFLFRIMTKRSQGPFPESGGRVKGIHSEAEWTAAMAGDKLVVCDFFATWCPPCRTAAPIYGKLSQEFLECEFYKVDVDECRSISQSQGISAMPTFIIYRKSQPVATVRGFQQEAIVQALLKQGAKRTTPSTSAPTSQESKTKSS